MFPNCLDIRKFLAKPEWSGGTMEMQMGNPINTIITPEEASMRLRISQSTLSKWRLLGVGPSYVKMGRRVRYREEDIQAWLNSIARQSTSEA